MNTPSCPCCKMDMEQSEWLPEKWLCTNLECELIGAFAIRELNQMCNTHYLQPGEAVVKVPGLEWKWSDEHGWWWAAKGDKMLYVVNADQEADMVESQKAACEDDYRRKWMDANQVVRTYEE